MFQNMLPCDKQLQELIVKSIRVDLLPYGTSTSGIAKAKDLYDFKSFSYLSSRMAVDRSEAHLSSFIILASSSEDVLMETVTEQMVQVGLFMFPAFSSWF